MKVITVSTQKGGVGKTTTVLAMCAGLAKMGYKVLGLDSDPQCNLTLGSGLNPIDQELTLDDIYENTAQVKDCIVDTGLGYDIIPSSLNLTVADLKYSGRAGREYILKKAMDKLDDVYDFCICDTPPQIGLLVENVLAITDKIIVPLTCDAFSIQGLSNYLYLLEELREDLITSNFKIAGILITIYSSRTNLTKTLEETITEIAEELNTKVFSTKIRKTVAVGSAQLSGMDIFTHSPNATATQDYKKFIEEFLEDIKNGE